MCVVRFTWHILEFYTHEISLEQLKLRFQILCTSWLCEILALWCLTIPHVGMVIVTWHHFYSLGPRLYLWSKFGMQLERKEYYNYMCSMGMKLVMWSLRILGDKCWYLKKRQRYSFQWKTNRKLRVLLNGTNINDLESPWMSLWLF